MQTLIYNATLVLPNRLIEKGWLLIEDGYIAALGPTQELPEASKANVLSIDAQSSFLLPGLIDIHCDAIEKLTEPRPGVHFDIHLGLEQAERWLIGCGITTEFHAVSLDDNEFGTRSLSFIRELSAALNNTFKGLIRHEIHARYEVTSIGGFEEVCAMLKRGETRLVSLMDHSPGQGQYTSEQTYRDYVKRTYHRSDEQIDDLLKHKKEQQSNRNERIGQVTGLAREAGISIATHDDDDPNTVANWPELGVSIAEFPTVLAAAAKAHELNLHVCMGAPNVLRGKSSGGNLSALEAIKAGYCDILCADYYPGAMLASVFKLVTDAVMDLPSAVRLITLNPARAVNMDDQIGSIQPGKKADLITVSYSQGTIPRVKQVFVEGRNIFTEPY